MEEENPHDSSSDPSETPLTPPQPEKKHHGPRPLDAGERTECKICVYLNLALEYLHFSYK